MLCAPQYKPANGRFTLRYRCLKTHAAPLAADGAGKVSEPENRGERSRRWPWVVAGIAALLPIVPIVVGAVIGSQGAGAATTPGFRPLQPGAATPPAHRTAPPPSGTTVALVNHSTSMRAAPGGRRIAFLPTHTDFGSPQALWVVARAPGWLGVISPVAGNGHIGWIPLGSASLTRVTWKLEVSLAARRLTVIHDGKVVHRYTVAIGRPSAPTPTGRFAVTDRLQTGDPSGHDRCFSPVPS